VAPTEAIAGVLIGGQSRRMGTCKALLPYRGTTLLDHVLSVVRSVVEEVVLLGNGELNTPRTTGMLRLTDEPKSGGPLAGLIPLLEYAGDRWALLIACDMPLIESDILRRLLRERDAAVDAVAFRMSDDGGKHSPCCVVFHPRAASAARLELARSRALQALIARVRRCVLSADAREARCLRSFNTPAEYAELVNFGGELAPPDALFQ